MLVLMASGISAILATVVLASVLSLSPLVGGERSVVIRGFHSVFTKNRVVMVDSFSWLLAFNSAMGSHLCQSS